MQCYNPAHYEEPLGLVCVDPACGEQGLICGQCEMESHVGHQKVATKHLLTILERSLEEEESVANKLGLTAEIDNICLRIRSDLFELNVCTSQSDRQKVRQSIASFTAMQREELEGYRSLLQQLLKASSNRDGQAFNEAFRLALHRFKICSEQKSPLKRIEFVRSILATTRSVKQSIEACIKSNSSLSAMLGCFNVRDKPVQRFRFSETNKGKTIKLTDPYTAIMQSSGSERMILMEPTLEGRSMPTKWKISIVNKKSWIGVGMCHLNTLKEASFNFEYTETGHGNYLISSNGYSWSSLKPQFNSHFQPFTFDTGDIIELTFSPKIKRLEFHKVGTEKRFELEFQFRLGDPLHPAINLTGVGDSVQILA